MVRSRVLGAAGAFKTGRHDDLVTALGLATQAPPAPLYVY